MALSKENTRVLLKAVLIFVIYLFYTKIVGLVFGLIGVTDSVTQMFIADLIFLFGIVLIYKEKIKNSYLDFKKNYKLSKKVMTILKWSIIVFAINIFMGMLTDWFFPEVSLINDDNSDAIYSLFNISSIYTIFKTMIFAVVAEELVFKQSIRDVFKNNVLFVVISAFIYVLMNFAYADLTQNFIWIDMLQYTLFSVVTSLAYIKNKDNIFIVMLVKFCCNLIPLTIMIMGVAP